MRKSPFSTHEWISKFREGSLMTANFTPSYHLPLMEVHNIHNTIHETVETKRFEPESKEPLDITTNLQKYLIQNTIGMHLGKSRLWEILQDKEFRFFCFVFNNKFARGAATTTKKKKNSKRLKDTQEIRQSIAVYELHLDPDSIQLLKNNT